MIEVNLIPDVKQELISARRTRSTVVSIAIIAMIASGAVVVLLALYVFPGQGLRDKLASDDIKNEFAELQETKDLANMLTVQNQLSKISVTHQDKMVTSRLFDVLSVVIPAPPNDISLTSTDLDSEDGILTITGQSANGFVAYEAFKKTIAATKLVYYNEGDTEPTTASLGSELTDGERSYGEDQDGRRVLKFSISFTYDEALFSALSKRMIVQGPERQNATDSAVAIPDSLFTAPATKTGENE